MPGRYNGKHACTSGERVSRGVAICIQQHCRGYESIRKAALAAAPLLGTALLKTTACLGLAASCLNSNESKPSARQVMHSGFAGSHDNQPRHRISLWRPFPAARPPLILVRLQQKHAHISQNCHACLWQGMQLQWIAQGSPLYEEALLSPHVE